MGDSEDEYDRKRRDKFRGERADVSYRGAERVARPRDEWSERDAWSRPRPREYRGGVRDRAYSPSMEPAPKRMRHDYYGESYYGHYPSFHQPAHRAANFFREPQGGATNSESATPPMMSFKSFLATQDDNISESEAIEKYNDYKLEFQRQQLNEFFVAHKDDEWFRIKYHPEDSVRRKEEQMAALQKRVDVFMGLLNNGKLDSISVDCSKTNQLLHLLDTVVVKLEGGNDEDLLILDQEYSEMEEKSKEQQKTREEIDEKKTKESEKNVTETKTLQNENDENEELKVDVKIETNGKNELEEGEEDAKNDEAEPEKMEEDHDEEVRVKVEKTETETHTQTQPQPQPEEAKIDEVEEAKKPAEGKEKKEKKRKRSRSFSGSSNNSSSSSSSSSESDEEKDEKIKPKPDAEKNAEDEVSASAPAEANKDKEAPNANASDDEKAKDDTNKIETIDEDDKLEKTRSALHKTTSIFLRNLAPTITKQEVEAICARYSGFLRVALAEPQPERRWMRRGWVTFKRDTNIKEICWNLNNIRLRDFELGAIVNRDLSKRIRPINGITAHKNVVRSDINVAARVVLHMDGKVGLWLDEDEFKKQQENNDSKDKDQLSFGLKSKNPVLHNITDYLIEEASAEEEELLGLEPSVDSADSAVVDRDETLISVLDKIIFYLRIVHSIDYYNHCEYPNEDEMPNRCGILHARGPAPTAKTDMTQFMSAAVENKMAAFLPEKKKKEENKNEAKLIQLSLKDQDTEIDKFVQANTRELAKDKWLCPLSGKKFKGPDFVRKHIFNKHGEKIEEVKKEVEFFNNYLKDLKRPMLTDAPQNKRDEIQAPYSHSNNYSGGGGAGGGGYSGGYNRPMPYNNYYSAPRSRGYAPRTRGAPTDYRPVIHYRDLDAPREPEEFI